MLASLKSLPSYLLLVGSATYDPRNFLGNNPNTDLVPTRMIDSQLFQTASDQWFADFTNSGVSQIAVGRLPVSTPLQASALISKIIAYDSSNVPDTALLTSDADTGFAASNQQLSGLLPPSLPATVLTRDAVTSNQAQLLADINSGPSLVNYIGHGNVNFWGGDWLDDTDVATLTNTQRPAFFVLMTCLNGYFVDPYLPSLAESLLSANGRRGRGVGLFGETIPVDRCRPTRLFTSRCSAVPLR